MILSGADVRRDEFHSGFCRSLHGWQCDSTTKSNRRSFTPDQGAES